MSIQRISISILVTSALIFLIPETVHSRDAADIEFFQERVEIDVTDSDMGGYDIHVIGYYNFRNPGRTPTERKLFYPFPEYEGTRYPEQIQIVKYMDLEKGETLPAIQLERGISFAIGIDPSSTLLVRVDYTQHTEVGRGVYITRTTSAWKRPLEVVEFVLSLPTTLCLTDINYPVDCIRKDENSIKIDIRMYDFMPEEDLIFEWRPDMESHAANP